MSPIDKDNFVPKLVIALFFTVGYIWVLPDLIHTQSDVLIFSVSALLFFAWVPALDIIVGTLKRDEEVYIINKMSNGKFAFYNEKDFFTASKEFDSLEEALYEFEIFYKKKGTKKSTLKIFV